MRKSLNHLYRLIWDNLNICDLWVRYEELVSNPEEVMVKISERLGCPLEVRHHWNTEDIHGPMFKLDRHKLLRSGTISKNRVGIWNTARKVFSNETHQTAKMMGTKSLSQKGRRPLPRPIHRDAGEPLLQVLG